MRKTKAARRAPDEEVPVAASSLRYIESSALVAALIERDAEAAAQISEIGRRVTSALTVAEATRAVIRARATERLTPSEERDALRSVRRFARRCLVVAVSDQILERAGRPFPVEPIRTLDAIHLATIESLGETPQLVMVITRDERVARNVRALHYQLA